MPLWKALPVSEEPEAVLVKWSVMETEAGKRHLVGIDVSTGVGRVSSAVVSFDACAKCAITRSGRTYHLSGPAGYDSDAAYTWDLWATATSVQTARDVTPEFIEATNAEKTRAKRSRAERRQSKRRAPET